MPNDQFPLSGPPPAEVPLPNAPLVKVIVQVKFPQLLKISDGKDLSEFQELIREDYPFLEPKEVDNQTIEIGPGGPKVQTSRSVIWGFQDETRNWNVSLAPDFVALETTSYSSRDDILTRLSKIISAVEDIYNPRIVTRLGMRYIDQIKDEAHDRLASFIRSDVMGIFGVTDLDRLRHGITEASFIADEGTLLMRCAHLAPQTTFDPNIVRPIAQKSWILDLDLSNQSNQNFRSADIVENVQRFSERLYATFRWLVTPDFLKYYGGEV